MLRIVDPPSGDPALALEELKHHLRVEEDDPSDNSVIASLADVAIEMIEAELQRAYALRTLAWVLPGWRECLRLPLAPVGDVVSIQYTDAAGEVRTLDPAAYFVTVSGATKEIRRRQGHHWPALGEGAEPVAITFKAGGEPMPKRVRQACKLIVGHLYDHREAVVANASSMGELPIGVQALISAERWS